MIASHFALPDLFEPWRSKKSSNSRNCQNDRLSKPLADVQKALSLRKRRRKKGTRKQTAPRPTPKSPVEYKVLSHVTVRIGKSFKSEIIGHICKGAIVVVNQVKGRRARVIRNTINGTIQIG